MSHDISKNANQQLEDAKESHAVPCEQEAAEAPQPALERGENDVLSKILSSSGDIGFIWNVDTGDVKWLGFVQDLFGIPFDRAVNFAEINKRINPQDLPLRLKKLHNHLEHSDEYQCDYRVRTNMNGFRWIRETGYSEVDEKTNQTIFYGVLRDISSEKSEIEDLKIKAQIHLATHLPNRDGFIQVVEEELEHLNNLKKQGHALEGSVFVVGIDRFNIIEEAYGSKVAEEIFKIVARRLEESFKQDGKTGVVAGDAFGVVLPRLNANYRRYRAFEVIKNFAQTPIITSAGPVRVTLSMGSISLMGDGFAPAGLISRAEMALEKARKFDQSGYHAYDVSSDKRDAYRNWIVTGDQFIQSMRDNRIVMAYQHVMDVTKNSAIFHESLIRMIDEEGNVIPAGMFIPAIEKMGLCRLADIHMVEKAIYELYEFAEIRLSVNISAMTVMDEEWMNIVRDLLKGKPEIASRLIVEITETAAMENIDGVITFIKFLHDLGCQVALDDFGAGQTSFSQLDKFNIDIVKIDGAFAQGMNEKEQNKLFLKAMHMLADGFGLQTVAEGVETMVEVDMLTQDGIHNLQGWAFGKPLLEREWVGEGDKRRSTFVGLDGEKKQIIS